MVKPNKRLLKFINKFKEEHNVKTLTDFYKYCVICNGLDAVKNLKQIILWLSKNSQKINEFSADDLINFMCKRQRRIQELKYKGLSTSIIDLSLYEIYFDSKTSELLFEKINNVKREKSKNWNEINPGKSDSSSLKSHIERFGEIDGKNRYDELCRHRKLNSNASLNWWLKKGYSVEDANVKLKERQNTFSLKKCITKYGIEDGTTIFNERQLKWQNTLNSKSIDEKRIINLKKSHLNVIGLMLRGYDYSEAIEKRKFNLERLNVQFLSKRNGTYYSMESFNFFKNKICLDISDEILYGKHEYYIIDSCGNMFFYDFTHLTKRVIIEYHGAAWHPNPRVLTLDEIREYKSVVGVNGIDILNKDLHKKQLALDSGFKYFDYYSNDALKMKMQILNDVRLALL